jgi:uncharacterized protein
MPNTASVFDSWALMAFLHGEPAAPRVEQLIWQAREDATALLISSVNLGEIWYSIARTRGVVDADVKVAEVLSLGFQVVDCDWALTYQAAKFKAAHRLAYADCFAAALAKLEGSVLVTGDREFKALEREIRIRWL